MRLHIVARGKIGRSPESDIVQRYVKRIAWDVRITELPDQGGRIPAMDTPGRLILLDETGRDMPSMEFAGILGRWRDDGMREARFMLGAADGFDDEARSRADLLLSFGRLTWPHMLARAMLAEQLWRATSILANHPYHREG
ncbi:23S rRNA (pseudouridine(1915)-N(3))-methyltransferase RlmH [Stakelama sp. CBK3Z-3]|uniref:Ribosomal RNA large subunit methyltransferase H n=1 Tax=Stakelama flava TaxID=2860338 RepID=A0ABS6XNW3_9SPHN|nr:23S rRNA (pseudouridine(1915)-N(3))-methyltransferase RlmH [Stakelama flava]MBW4331915.1 23S rRNA (pseudouridine(1915)-N(3))-methyltransferase RlmH [Stakelama flava]